MTFLVQQACPWASLAWSFSGWALFLHALFLPSPLPPSLPFGTKGSYLLAEWVGRGAHVRGNE